MRPANWRRETPWRIGLEYAAVRSRLAPVSLAPAAARRLVAKGWAEPYEMLTGLEAIRLTDEGMRAHARLV